MKKRLLSAVLAMCMMLCSAAALPENSFAQSSDIAASAASLPITGKCGDNVKWSLSDGNLTIVGTGKMYNYTNSIAAISGFSENKEAALKVLNEMYANKELYRLIQYGFEGEHYIINDDGTMSIHR